MIISASRRTDIPAFYTEWFMHRVREGYCDVANPFRADQVSRVSLRAEDVDVIVFVTRNARPLLPHLAELDARGLRYSFQYTLTGYPRQLEANTPAVSDALDALHRLVEHIGPERLIWRYDPILFTTLTPPVFHVKQFTRLAEALRDLTRRVTVSIMDDYRWVSARLKRLEREGVARLEMTDEELGRVLRSLAAAAHAHGMEIFSCAEPIDLSPYGIAPGKCIDDAYIRRVFGIDVTHRKDPSQRKPCGCIVSKDIGAYDTCIHGCVYCYATRNGDAARRRHAAHRVDTPALWELNATR
ncbi:MAG: DUF1848 domain-containing protein [Armatimonadota bacterium]